MAIPADTISIWLKTTCIWVVCTYNNGGGQTGCKQNDSVPAVLKVNAQMTKILDSLGIKPSLVLVDDDDEDDIDL